MLLKRTVLSGVAAGVLLLSACSEESPVAPTSPLEPPVAASQQEASEPELIPDQYIVVFSDEVSDPLVLAEQFAANFDLSLLHRYQHAIKGFASKIPSGAVEAIEAHPLVAYVEQDAYSYVDFVAAPTNLNATVASATQMNLTWQDNANNERRYEVERSANGGGFSQIARLRRDFTSYTDNDSFTANWEYCYRVRATGKRNDVSGYSNTECVTPNPTAPPEPPASPSGLSATTFSSSAIDLAWSDNSNDEDGFRIERCAGQGCSNFSSLTTVGANVASYRDGGLPATSWYTYRVWAFNGAGDSDSPTNSAEARTDDPPPPPAAPTGLSATATSSSTIDLAWTDNANNEDGFRIRRCTGQSCTPTSEIATVGPNTESYTDEGLTAETWYTYDVLAYNDAGDSGPSDPASAQTDAGPPPGQCDDTGNHDSLSQLWGISKVQANQNPTWQGTQNGGSCAIQPWFFGLDTGVDSDHPDLNVIETVDFVGDGSGGEDGHGHGTHTAGTAAAKDGNGGVVGVAPGARIYGFKVCTDGGSCPNSAIIAGIDEVTARKNANSGQPMVANMSLGGGISTSIDQAVRRSVNSGVVYALSAGNGVLGACWFPNDAQNASPARTGDDDINASNGSNGDTRRVNGVLTTTSSNQNDQDVNCNYGNPVTIASPGVSIYSTWLNGGYNTISGTSMASPHSAGAALLYLHAYPSATPTQVEQAIVNLLDPWSTNDNPNASGRLNVKDLF